jgi:hypothetical protein
MNLAEAPMAVLRFQYQLARIPLELFEQQVMTRLGTEAPARLLYERGLGTLDATVGKLLNDPELQRRGTALVDRSDTLARAAQLDASASATRRQAERKFEAIRVEVATDLEETTAATEQETIKAREDAEERKRAADQKAATRAAAVKKKADEAASERAEAAKATNRQKSAKITAVEQTKTQAAEAKLDDAQAKYAEAARKRAHADRVEELADVEKQNRKSNGADES